MAVVKFSKQKIQPNPLEVDYWVDITSNPNGGRIKYHNGENWVDLLNTEGGYVNLYDYYTKTEINKMFERTATVDDIEGKLDEEDVVNVIEDIQFKEGDDTIEMVMLKHNNTTVSVTMPVASKDQLQSLSSAFYKAIDEIKTQYQHKLTAGENITIDNNIISADIESIDYNKINNVPNFALQSDLQKEINRATTEEAALGTRITSHVTTVETELDLKADKSNTYTKSQIDAKLSGIYRVKGSCTFESLPTNPTVGDAWNITNDFTLNGESYPFGTNVVYTENGWDALAGIFDSSELEESINTVDQSLSQETIRAVKAEQANADNINTEYNRAIAAEEQLQTNINIVDGKLVNYLPLTGGTLSNTLRVNRTTYPHLILNATDSTNGQPAINFAIDNTIKGYVGYSPNFGTYLYTTGKQSYLGIKDDGEIQYTKGTIWHSNNDGAGSGLDADLLDGKQPSELNVGSATKLQTARTLWGQSFDGTNNVDGGITFDNDKYIMWKSADGSSKLGVLSVNESNNLYVGYDMPTKGYDTYIDGNNIRLRYGTHTTGILLNSSGNVTIGSSNLASTSYKLYVDGKVNITDQITSGELVDWYGVSWSENGSNPACTRIGNMAMHRSLPIQSAMKGYAIDNVNTIADSIEVIVPLDDNDFRKTKYNSTSNTQGSILSNWNCNIMVKIPEFWYIDDYEPSTKTHNLKLSQTAKAGWCHHKEAYVGAYEGYIKDDTTYMSMYEKVPTVNVSRTTLRSLARANGFEGESKWNIYTYEEHRAICHLFLVEYATRNSQAAVNTTLTADGFKQGGLGSGCTTGSVTINGTTAYSFVPTGTTDSLGSGSGQVAYTVTQTDADGNATGTVTRYANRYRGIENPFGHIWKHVDDIISIYNSTSTYRTQYKCEDPSSFDTNKNSKYKPICCRKVVANGYKKEIAATRNCDFFAETTGAIATSHWCDYNYENTDTSEHCLLIGGYSDYGAYAGLFAFFLGHGVGYSHVSVGSRLTYLPWAE